MFSLVDSSDRRLFRGGVGGVWCGEGECVWVVVVGFFFFWDCGSVASALVGVLKSSLVLFVCWGLLFFFGFCFSAGTSSVSLRELTRRSHPLVKVVSWFGWVHPFPVTTLSAVKPYRSARTPLLDLLR